MTLNDLPEHGCRLCGDCMYEDDRSSGFLCEAHVKHGHGEDRVVLVVNSPRIGIRGAGNPTILARGDEGPGLGHTGFIVGYEVALRQSVLLIETREEFVDEIFDQLGDMLGFPMVFALVVVN